VYPIKIKLGNEPEHSLGLVGCQQLAKNKVDVLGRNYFDKRERERNCLQKQR